MCPASLIVFLGALYLDHDTGRTLKQSDQYMDGTEDIVGLVAFPGSLRELSK
jgi:hypothetical protein